MRNNNKKGKRINLVLLAPLLCLFLVGIGGIIGIIYSQVSDSLVIEEPVPTPVHTPTPTITPTPTPAMSTAGIIPKSELIILPTPTPTPLVVLKLGSGGGSSSGSSSSSGSGSGSVYLTTTGDSLPPDLMIKDPDEDIWQDGVTATWTMSNTMPGDSVSSWVKFINSGDTEANILMVNCTSVTIDDPGPESDTEEGTTDLDKQMIITEMTYYHGYQGTKQIDCLSLLIDNNDNGNIDLD
ncbi:unnamed protein product, partial [marine sediment metagenome]